VLALVGIAGAAAKVGEPAPEFKLSLLDGRTVSLKGFRGKPILVNFWHSG
jgi:peroxiredoxin